MIQVYFSAHLTGTRRLTVTLIKHVFQHLLVLLHKPSSAVIAKYAQEHILVVGEMSHILDEIKGRAQGLGKMYFQTKPT